MAHTLTVAYGSLYARQAAPGEVVRAAVSLATKDGAKTHKAWLSASKDKIFEYRGQPSDTPAQKAEKVYEITEFNPDGTIKTE